MGAPADWLRDDGWIGLVAAAAVYSGFALYGAMKPQTALAFCVTWSVLALVCLIRPRVRQTALRPRGLGLVAALFCAVVLLGLWSLTPFTPGGPHPTWAYLGISPGAATINKASTLTELLKLLGLGCVFIVGLAAGSSDNRARMAVNAILAAGSAYGIWAFFAYLSGRGPGHSRLEASFLSANTAATVFAALLVLSFGPLVRQLRSEQRQPWIAASPFALGALIFFGCLLVTASRGGFTAALCGLAGFVLLQLFAGQAKLSQAIGAVAAGAVVVLALMASAGDLLINRLLGAREDLAERAAINQLHWAAFKESPLLGYGMGSFDDLNRTLLSGANFRDGWNIRATHNVYLSWLEQAGALGAALMFSCIGAIIFLALRASLSRTRTTNLLFAIFATNLVFLAHGLTDFALEMFAVAAFWTFLLGLQFSLAQGSSRR